MEDGFGYRPRHLHLLDEQLHLDPDIQRQIQEIEARMAARRYVDLFLNPDWRSMMPTWQALASRQGLLGRTPRSFSGHDDDGPVESVARGAGPETPRPGEIGDVTRALYALPAVQRIVLGAHDEGMRQLHLLGREWDQASTGDRVVMVTMTTLVVGSSVAIIVANRQTRDLAFDLIKGHDIPIPGVDGLSFQILDRGGSVTAPLGVPGLSGSARLQFPQGRSPDYEVTVTFDVMEFVRSRR